VDGAAANLSVWNTAIAPAATTSAPAATAAAAPGRQADRPAFADVVATVSALSTEAVTRPAAPKPVARPQTSNRTNSAATSRSGTTPAATARSSTNPATGPRTTRGAAQNAAARPVAAAARTGPAAHPSRIWVQLAVSPNRSAFSHDISRLRKAAPNLMKDRTAHVAPIGSNHRLLVGPFPSAAAARTFVNGLKQKDITALPWTSPAGTEVERFAAGR
jgi:hypothetical protein